jgi:hypothetical protein
MVYHVVFLDRLERFGGAALVSNGANNGPVSMEVNTPAKLQRTGDACQLTFTVAENTQILYGLFTCSSDYPSPVSHCPLRGWQAPPSGHRLVSFSKVRNRKDIRGHIHRNQQCRDRW